MRFPAHPAAELFPMMEGDAFEALAEDILENGQREPVILYQGQILDGRNRVKACEWLGIDPVTEEWTPKGTPETFVVSMNLHRRHLNETQRAMIAGRIATRTARETLIQATKSKNLPAGQICPPGNPSLQEAANLLNVGRHSAVDAKLALREATPEEIAALDAGKTSVSSVAKRIRNAHKGAAPEKKDNGAQKRRINSEVWGRIRDALTHLTSLPLPADAAVVAHGYDKAGLVKARLQQSINWLKDFEHEWSRRDQASS